MTLQEAIDKSCSLATLIMNLLTGTSADSYEGIPSMRKIINDTKNKAGAVWSASLTYAPGDLISYSGNLYVALVETTGEQPDTTPASWELKGSQTLYNISG